MSFWVIQTLNAVSEGMLLFLLAAGFSLIFGLVRVLNLAHGSFYLLGAYVGASLLDWSGSFIVAIAGAMAGVAVLAVVMERWLIRPVYGDELRQALLTFGCLFIIGDAALWIWGGNPISLAKPEGFTKSLFVGDIVFPSYRLLVIGIGILMGGVLWWVQEKTRLGALIRAGVEDAEMTRGMGTNISVLFAFIFAAGGALAGLAGTLGGVIVGAYPGADLEVLMLAFVVIIIGGMGSLKGAFVGAVVVGLLDTWGKTFFPEFSMFTIFVPMVFILAIWPSGLFGRT
jgi:branched-chain amino acid transport system permease protein